MRFIILLLFCLPLSGASKPDPAIQALQVQIAQMQAQLKAAANERASLAADKASLSATVSKLTALETQRAATLAVAAATAAKSTSAASKAGATTAAAINAASDQASIDAMAASRQQAQIAAATVLALQSAMDSTRTQIAESRKEADVAANAAAWRELLGGVVILIGLAKAAIDRHEAKTTAAKEAAHNTAALGQIHTLVNSKMTEQMERELATLQANAILLQEAVDARRAAGLNPAPEAPGLIESTRAKVAELQAQLRDRKEATDTAAKVVALETSQAENPPPRR